MCQRLVVVVQIIIFIFTAWTTLAHMTMFLKRLKKPYKYVLRIFIACLVFITACNLYVNIFTSRFLFDNTDSIPQNQYGLILGTSKYLTGGGNNSYFDHRIYAAYSLFQDGLISQIICSGDNMSDKYYNEPKAMSKALKKIGVPDSVIWIDKEGLNTRQSVQNFIRNYNVNSVTIITQKFHNQRAIFIARKAGLEAVGYNAADVYFYQDIKTHVREWFAKVKAVMINLFN